MQIEYELRILNINRESVEKKLLALGAGKVHGDELQRRWILDLPDNRLWATGGWVRVRQVGELRTELSFKRRTMPHAIDSASEIYLEISNRDAILDLLKELGLEVKKYNENKRTRYKAQGVVFDIDTWPTKNPYVEIEATDSETVWEWVHRLGFTKDDVCFVAGPELYKLLGFSEEQMKDLRFSQYENNR